MIWIGATLLAILACVFVLMPLVLVRREDVVDVDRDQINIALYVERKTEQDDEAQANEPKKDRLSDAAAAPVASFSWGHRRIVFAVALLLPVMAFFIYSDSGFGRGAIADVGIAATLAGLDDADKQTYEALAQQIEGRLAVHPDDDDMQFLLASLYGGLGRYEEAAALYASMLEQFPEDASLLSQYAEVLFVADNRKLTPRSLAAIEAALRVNPADITMLEIRGIGALENGEAAEALEWFGRALNTGVTGRRAELIRIAIAQIQQRAGMTGANQADGEKGAEQAVAGRIILVNLSLIEGFDVPDSAVVFVYARAVEGPAAPLAVSRFKPADLPVQVRLDESMAMMPGMSLENFDKVMGIARLSLRGDVAAQPGDIEVRSGVIEPSDEPVTVTLEMSQIIQ